MGVNASVRIRGITDGTSKTIMLAEIRAGLTQADVRGTWAMSGGGPSSVWAFGFLHSWDPQACNGPNDGSIHSDCVEGCNHVHETYGGGEPSGGAGIIRAAQLGMGCAPGDQFANCHAGPRSLHPGGVYVCFSDGSVRWIGNYIEVGYNPDNSPEAVNGQPGVWDLLNASADGGTFGGSEF